MSDTTRPSSLLLPPAENASVVGFAEAQIIAVAALPQVTADLVAVPPGAQPPPALLETLEPQMKTAVEMANSQYFRFTVRFLFEEGQPLVGHLEDDAVSLPGLDADHSTRKLTVFVPLGSPEAPVGRISFSSLDGKTRDLVSGTAYMFPSFLAHEIIPDQPFPALIAHALGPAFS